ncbi:hypothetical protein Q1695_012062 [Nippostrongylus brasiliensis]|nr:hypothetical protein Q1695_012062 [Nippostrongylus brasiliensis]
MSTTLSTAQASLTRSSNRLSTTCQDAQGILKTSRQDNPETQLRKVRGAKIALESNIQYVESAMARYISTADDLDSENIEKKVVDNVTKADDVIHQAQDMLTAGAGGSRKPPDGKNDAEELETARHIEDIDSNIAGKYTFLSTARSNRSTSESVPFEEELTADDVDLYKEKRGLSKEDISYQKKLDAVFTNLFNQKKEEEKKAGKKSKEDTLFGAIKERTRLSKTRKKSSKEKGGKDPKGMGSAQSRRKLSKKRRKFAAAADELANSAYSYIFVS